MLRSYRRPNDGFAYELLNMSHEHEHNASIAETGTRMQDPDTDAVRKTAMVGEELNSNANSKDEGEGRSLAAVGDVAALPTGTIDPVYEAKAKVLNHAVSCTQYPHVMMA